MEFGSALTAIFGTSVGKRLLEALAKRPNASQRMEQAGAAIAKGASAVEALKAAFGNEFMKALTEALGNAPGAGFSYEAGVNAYIKADLGGASDPRRILRDELNLNLDRIALAGTTNKGALKNHFKGALHVWRRRYQELAPDLYTGNVKAVFKDMDRLLDDTEKSFKDVYKLARITGLGVPGALLLIQGVFLATGTGVGIVAAISAFIFGIPWLHVGALVLPGAFMVALAAMHLRDDQAMSACVRLAYKLLDTGAHAATAPSVNSTPTR
jgi:hypothetical protein